MKDIDFMGKSTFVFCVNEEHKLFWKKILDFIFTFYNEFDQAKTKQYKDFSRCM